MNRKQIIINAIASIVAFAATIATLNTVFRTESFIDKTFSYELDLDELLKESDEMHKKLISLKEMLESTLAATDTSQISVADIVQLKYRIANLDSKLDSIGNISLGLRQSINPKNPEEILVIARLADRVSNIEKDVSSFKSDMKSDYTNFVVSVQREIDTRDNSIILLLIAVIPLLLSMGYNMWKDYKRNGDN